MLSRENSTAADPRTRLEFCKGDIDRLFGCDFSRDHPELTAAVMLSTSAGVVLDEVASEVDKGRSDLAQVIQNLVDFDAHIRSVGNFEYLPDNQAILD